MAKDEDKVPEHIRKAQEEFLRKEKERTENGEKADPPGHYAIDWETGEPLKDPKYRPPKSDS